MKVNIGPYPGNKSNKERRVNIHIDDYDLWNLDDTLAMIIVPCLEQFKNNLISGGSVDNEDVPEELRCDDISNPIYFEKWGWVLNEMHWAFTQKTIDWESQYYTNGNLDREDKAKHYMRMQNGFRLFGKYYNSLWD